MARKISPKRAIIIDHFIQFPTIQFNTERARMLNETIFANNPITAMDVAVAKMAIRNCNNKLLKDLVQFYNI